MGINKKIKVMLKVEEMSQEQISQEITKLDSQLDKLINSERRINYGMFFAK
jgi:hypothetical protein